MGPELEDTPETPAQKKAWMIIFTDLVSLMLTFFVMLFAMSNVKVDKWDSMIDALSQSLNVSRAKAVVTSSAEYNVATIVRKQAINLDYLASVLEKTVAEHEMLAHSRIMRLEDRLVIALPGDLLFTPARADLSEKAREAVFNLGGVLRNIGNQIEINGHTDPVPATGGEYASNWELSLARAAAVANALRRSGYTEDIVALGFADSRFSQLPDLPTDQRHALGRRVDIVVLPNAGGV
ncbi:MAG: OmpA family protein [Proteobacteria bacterium]|nr:OmpA family protein [Pseudomonadota bacterium]